MNHANLQLDSHSARCAAERTARAGRARRAREARGARLRARGAIRTRTRGHTGVPQMVSVLTASRWAAEGRRPTNRIVTVM